MLQSPAMPDAGHGGSRVDQYTIEIEEEGGTSDLGHQPIE